MVTPKHKDQRVGVLLDLQNLYYSARVLHGKKVNFKALLDEAIGGRKLIRAIAYGISTVEGMEEKFFDALRNLGYEVKTKDLQIFPGGAKKGDWDVGLAIDAVKMSKTPPAVAWRASHSANRQVANSSKHWTTSSILAQTAASFFFRRHFRAVF